MAKFVKQRHGRMNPIFHQEEVGLIAAIAKAHSSTTNSQVLGRNGEKGVMNFLNRHLPSCFRTETGHFVTPRGDISPQIDIMMLDARYPLLANNDDGSVIAMLHSVIATIEVKLSLKKTEIANIRRSGQTIDLLNSEVFPKIGDWGSVSPYALAYQTKIRLETVGKHFFEDYEENDPDTCLFVLRLHDADQPAADGALGARFWLEGGSDPSISKTFAPLSDLYYELVQSAYYTLSTRGFSFGDLGSHMLHYMTWGTYPGKTGPIGVSP